MAHSYGRDVSATTSEMRHFRLYVAGQTPNSLLALANLRKICGTYLQPPYELEVINALEEAQRAAEDNIIAVPTLLQVAPEPVRRIIGDLANTAHVLAELDLQDATACAAEDPPVGEYP